MAPTKKQDGRSKRNSKSASDSNDVCTNTRRSSSRSSSRKSSCDSGKRVPASNIINEKKSKDHSTGNLDAECESIQEKLSQNVSDIDIYGDLVEEMGDDGGTEANGNYKPNSYESDLQNDIFNMGEKSETPIKDKTVVASKKLEDKINTKQKDIQLNSEKIQERLPARKSSKNEELEEANLDLFDDLIISRKNQVSTKEVLELKQELERVNFELHKSREYCAKLEEDNEQLLKNTSSLWKTALAQIRGKISEISTLKREKEQIIFRRAMRQVARDDLDRAVSRIAAYNKEEFAEFMEGMKKEPSCSCGGAGAQANNPGQKHSTLLNKSIQEKVLGNRVGANDDRDALMLQKHLGKAGEKITLRPDLQQKQKHVGTNRQHFNNREEGLNKKKGISKKNIEENEKVPEENMTKERATKNRLTKAYARCDRYVEEDGENRLGPDHRTMWREDGDGGRHSTRSNTRDESRKNEFRFESGDERYDPRRTKSTHSKEGSGTNESDGDLLTDQRRVRNRDSRLDNERNLSDDEVFSSRRRTRSKDKKDLKNRIGKKELIDKDKRSRNKRKRSESPDKDIRIKRESRRNKSKDDQQEESNTRMSVFERMGRNKADKNKTVDIRQEIPLHDQRNEESDKYLDNSLADANNILKKIGSDITHKVEYLIEDYPSRTRDQTSKIENAGEGNVDIDGNIAYNKYDQIAENVQYDNDIDYEKIKLQNVVAKDTEEDNLNSMKICNKKQNLGSLNDENGMPNTLFAQRMKDRLAGKSVKTVARPKIQASSKATLNSNMQCQVDTEAAKDVSLPDILQNLVPSINSCEFKSVEGNSSLNYKSEEPKIKKDFTHPVSGNEVSSIIHTNNYSSLKETNAIIDNNSLMNTSIEGPDPKTFESSKKPRKGKEVLKGCLKDLLLGLKKSNDTKSLKSKNYLESKDKVAYDDKIAEREETDTISDTENVLEICDPVNLDKRNLSGSEADPPSESKDKVVDNNETVESEEEESASDGESGLEIDETVDLDHASSHGLETFSLTEGKDKVSDNDKAVSRKEISGCGIETEQSNSLQINESINLSNSTSHVPETSLESEVTNNDKIAEKNENDSRPDKDCNHKTEQTNSLLVNDCPVNLDNDFDSLEDILSDMGLEVSPNHDSKSLPFVPLENDKVIKMKLSVEDKLNSILTSPHEDKANSSLSSPIKDRTSRVLAASLDDIGNKDISDSHTVKSIDKVLELKTKIYLKSAVEVKDSNKQVPGDIDSINEDVNKIPKKSFRIPKLKKTTSITEKVDEASNSSSTTIEDRGRSVSMASVDNSRNKEISDLCTVKSLEKVLEIKTNIDPKCVVEEKDCNKEIPDDEDNLNKDFDKISKKSFKIPKIKKTPSITEKVDKVSSSLSPLFKDTESGALSQSVNDSCNKEISDSCTVKSLEKDLELKTNIELKFTVEEKEYDKHMPDDKDDTTKSFEKTPKKSFRIPKLKKTPSITEKVDRLDTSTNTLEHPRRSKRKSTEGIKNDDEYLDKTESTLREADCLETKNTARKDDSFTCTGALNHKESRMSSEKESLDSLTSSEVKSQKESHMVVKNKSQVVPDQVVDKSVQIQRTAKKSKNRMLSSDSCSDEQESNSSSDEQVIRSKVRKSKTQRSRIRRLRIESDSSTDEEEIKNDIVKSPLMETQTKDQTSEYSSVTETSLSKSPTDNKYSDKSPTGDRNKEALNFNTSFPQHFKRRIKKKHTSVVLTAVSSTVVNCSPNKNNTEIISISNSKEISETHAVKSLDKILEPKSKIETKIIIEEKDCKKQSQDDKKNINEDLNKIPSIQDAIHIDKDKYKIPKIKNSNGGTKEVDRIHTSVKAIKRGSVELKDTMNILRNIVARNVPKQISENLETRNHSEKISKVLKESNVSDMESNVDDRPRHDTFQPDIKNKSDKHTKKDNKGGKDISKKDRKANDDIESKVDMLMCNTLQTDTKINSDKHAKKENKFDKNNLPKDRKSKRISLLFDENVEECSRLFSSEEECKKSNGINYEKGKKHVKGSKHLNEKVAKKISSLFDEEIPAALTDKKIGKATLIDCLTDEKQNEDAIFSSDSSISNSNNTHGNLYETEATEDKIYLEKTKSQNVFEPKSSSFAVEETSKNMDGEIKKKVINSVTENHQSPFPKMGDFKDEQVSVIKENDSPMMIVTKDLIMSDTDSSINILTEDINKDVFETPKIVNKAGTDTFSEMISPRTEKHNDIHNEYLDKNTSFKESKCLEDRHTSSNESECLEENISHTKPKCIEANNISCNPTEYLDHKGISSKDPENLEDNISSKDPEYSEENVSSKASEHLDNMCVPPEEPECHENREATACLERVHNEDFLELFATDSLAGDTDFENTPTKKKSKKTKEINFANTNVDKWKQSFSGKPEMETSKSKDKTRSFIKVDCKSAFGIEERKIREPEIETEMSRKVTKEKSKRSEKYEVTKKSINYDINESKSCEDNAIDKMATKSLKANEKSNDKVRPVCRRSPRKHQNPLKKDEGDSWFPSEEELLFDESDSSIEDKEIGADASRNLFDAKSLNSKSEGEKLSNKIDKNYKTKDKSNTIASVNNKETTQGKDRNHRSLTKSDSEKNDTRRTSSRHKDGPLTLREKRGRSSPSRERRSDRKLRSPIRSPNRKLRSPVRSPNRKLRSPVRSPNRKLRSPVRSPNRKQRSPLRSPNRKFRSPVRSPEKYHQRVLTSPREKRESPKGRTSPKSKHIYDESNTSPRGRSSPKRKDSDYRGRERNRREDRRPDSAIVNTRERSTRSRKESTHDESRVNARGERKVSIHDEIINDHGSNRNSDTRRSRHSSGDEKRSKDDHRRRLDYKDKQRDRDDRTKEIRGRSDERPRRREKDLKHNINVGDRKTEEKLTVGDDLREEVLSIANEKTEEKSTQDNVCEPKLVVNVPISKAPVNPELIKKFTESRSSDMEEGELDDEEEGEIKESENEEIEENYNEMEKDATLNKRGRRTNEIDIKKEEPLCDTKLGDVKAKSKDNRIKSEDSKNKDNLHKEQKCEIFSEKRIPRKEDKKLEYYINKEETRESKIRKETEELLDELGKDEYVNKRKKSVEIDREKDRIPNDIKYRNKKVTDEEEKNKNYTKENKSSRREPSQEYYRNKDMDKARENNARSLQHKRSPTRSERPRRRITPIRIENTREVESRHRLRSGSPRKSDNSRRSDKEKSEESHERKSRRRVITDRRENTPLIDHSQRPLRRIKPVTLVSEPDPSTLFRVTKISEPKENFFNKFMNSIGLESQQNIDDNVDYLGRSKTVKNQLYSDTNEYETEDKIKNVIPKNLCDSGMSILQYVGKNQQETTKSFEMESVDEADACQIMQEKKYAENTVTMVETYKLEEIEKFICKDNSKKSPFDLRKLHPLDPRLKLLSQKRTCEVVADEKVELSSVDDNKDLNTQTQEEDISSSIDLCKQLELSSDVNNQDSNSNSMDLFGKIRNNIKIVNTASESSKDTTEPTEKDESDSDDSSSSDSSTTEDSSSCPAAPSSSSRSSNLISSSSKSSHINSISKSPKTGQTPSIATKRLNFGDFKIPKSLSDDNSVLPDVVFPLKSGNNPIAVQFGNAVSTSPNRDDTDISSQEKEIENPSLEFGNKILEIEQVKTAEISKMETTEEMRIPKSIEEFSKEAAQETSPNNTDTTEKNSDLEMDNEQMNSDNIHLEQMQDDLTTAQEESVIADETMVMEDLRIESDSESNNSDQSNHSAAQSSKCGNSSSSSSGSSSSSSDSDSSTDSEGEKDGGVASDPANSSQALIRRSSRNKSPTKSPTKSISKSPRKPSSKSPKKSPAKSFFKSPTKSPSKSYISPPLTPRTPKISNSSKDPVVNTSPSMPRLFDSTPKKSPKKHNLSYKKTPSPQKKVHKLKSPKKSLVSSKSLKMTEHNAEIVVSKSPCKKLLALSKSPRKSPRKSPSKIMSPEKSPCKLTSPKTPGKSPCKSLRSPCKKMLHKSPLKFNNTPCKFTSPEKSPWKTSSPRTPGKDLMASMMSPPMAAFMSPGHTISHLWKSPKKTIRKNEPLLLNDQANYLPFQSPPGEKSINLNDEDIYNSPVLKKDENIAVKDDELSLLLDLENLASETERNGNEENIPNKSVSMTSGEEDSVLSALALSPEETPARPNVSKQENVTPKSLNEVSFKKENRSRVDVTPKVYDVLSTPKTNGAAEIMENFSITPKVNLELQATSTPKFLSTDTPKTGRSKLLQQEIHVTPITIDLNSTPKSNSSNTTINSNKTLVEPLQETPKSHKISADNSQDLGLDNISQRSINKTPNINSEEKPKNESIVGVTALHISLEENIGNKSNNNVSGGSKEPSPGSPRRIRAYVTASGQLRVPRRRPNFGAGNGMPAFSCSQPTMNSVSIVHTDENTVVNKSSHKKQLFPTRENGPTKRALSPSVSPMAETENMPDKKIKIMSPRSYHQNVAKRSLVTEGSTQSVTKKLLNGDSSSNLPSNILSQTPPNEKAEASKNSITASTVSQPLSLIGSNQTVIVRRKKRKRDFNPSKT